MIGSDACDPESGSVSDKSDLIVNVHMFSAIEIIGRIEDAFDQTSPFYKVRRLATEILEILLCHLAHRVSGDNNRYFDEAVELLVSQGGCGRLPAEDICDNIVHRLQWLFETTYSSRWQSVYSNSNILINKNGDIVLYECPRDAIRIRR